MTPIGFDTRSGTLVVGNNNVYPARTLAASIDAQGMVDIRSLAGRSEQFIRWDQITDLSSSVPPVVFASPAAVMSYLAGEFGRSVPLGFSYDFAASTQVRIAHNLGFYPNVIVVDSAGDPGLADPRYPDVNTVVLTFAAPTSGTAYLS